MSSFDKLLVNSTNRFSAVKNIIISQSSLNQQNQQCMNNVKVNKVVNGQQYLNIKSSIRKEDNKNLNNNNDKMIKSMNKNVRNFLYNYKNQIKCSNSAVYDNLPIVQQQQISQTYQQLLARQQQLMKTIEQSQNQHSIMLSLYQKFFKIENGSLQQLKRRYRRKKTQIQNKYECEYENCDKIYSTSTSLIRHVKLKHLDQQFEPPQPNYQIPPVPNLGNIKNRNHINQENYEKSCADNQYEESDQYQQQYEDTQKKQQSLNYYNIRTLSEQQQQEQNSIIQENSQQRKSLHQNQQNQQNQQKCILRNQTLNQNIIINYEALSLVKNKKTKMNEDQLEEQMNI